MNFGNACWEERFWNWKLDFSSIFLHFKRDKLVKVLIKLDKTLMKMKIILEHYMKLTNFFFNFRMTQLAKSVTKQQWPRELSENQKVFAAWHELNLLSFFLWKIQMHFGPQILNTFFVFLLKKSMASRQHKKLSSCRA